MWGFAGATFIRWTCILTALNFKWIQLRKVSKFFISNDIIIQCIYFFPAISYPTWRCDIYRAEKFVFCWIFIILKFEWFYHISNKRPMGHIAQLRKQFKSLNKYDYIITLIQRIKKKLYENLLVLHLNKLESPSSKDSLCQVWLKLAQWFWRRDFFNFVNVFSLIL